MVKKKKTNWVIKHPKLSLFLGILIISVILSMIFEESPSEMIIDRINLENQSLSDCPIQGTFQSDKSYFIEIYMLNKTDSSLNKNNAEKLYDMGYSLGGNDMIKKKIKLGLCSKCGICE